MIVIDGRVALQHGAGAPDREMGGDGVDAQQVAGRPAGAPAERVKREIRRAGRRVDRRQVVGDVVSGDDLADRLADHVDRGRVSKHDFPALLDRAAVGDGDRVLRLVVGAGRGRALGGIEPAGPGLLVEHHRDARMQVADDQRAGDIAAERKIMRQCPGESQLAVDLDIADQRHVLDPMLNADRLAVAGDVGKCHRAGIEVVRVAGRDGQPVVTDDAGLGQAHAADVNSLPVANGLRRRLRLMMDDRDIAAAEDRHPSVDRQAHRVEAENVGR